MAKKKKRYQIGRAVWPQDITRTEGQVREAFCPGAEGHYEKSGCEFGTRMFRELFGKSQIRSDEDLKGMKSSSESVCEKMLSEVPKNGRKGFKFGCYAAIDEIEDILWYILNDQERP